MSWPTDAFSFYKTWVSFYQYFAIIKTIFSQAFVSFPKKAFILTNALKHTLFSQKNM
jgi:hypothetical protein